MFAYRSKEEWIQYNMETLQQQKDLYDSNNRLQEALAKELEVALDDERADCLYQESMDFYFQELDDYVWLISIFQKLIPYYEEKQDYVRLVYLYGALDYEWNEVRNRQLHKKEQDFTYIDKLIEMMPMYSSFTDRKIRKRFWNNYYNKIIVGLEKRCITVREAYQFLDEMKQKWNSEEVQSLDANDVEMNQLISLIRLRFGKGLLQILDEEKEIQTRFYRDAQSLYEERKAMVKSEYEIEPVLFASNFQTCRAACPPYVVPAFRHKQHMNPFGL